MLRSSTSDVGPVRATMRLAVVDVAGLGDDRQVLLGVEQQPQPARTTAWSSASTTRIGSIRGTVPVPALVSVGTHRPGGTGRSGRDRPGASRRPRPDSDRGRAEQPTAPRRARRSSRRDSLPHRARGRRRVLLPRGSGGRDHERHGRRQRPPECRRTGRADGVLRRHLDLLLGHAHLAPPCSSRPPTATRAASARRGSPSPPPTTEGDNVYSGTFQADPLYSQRQSDPHDIAVVVLDKPGQGDRPGRLPDAGSLRPCPADQSSPRWGTAPTR